LVDLTPANVAVAAEQAAGRVAGLVRKTPLQYSPQFSDDLGAEIYFKLENLQHTGSFKLRGAANRLMTMTASERDNGCVAASSGNHGAAVAYAMQKLNTRGVIFVPQQTSSTKVAAIRSYGGTVEYFGTDGLDTEQHARQFAEANGMAYLSPYNDEQVIAGQGTCGIEIRQQLPAVDDIFVAVGGGGLISGVASVLKASNPDIMAYGCQPEASAVMARSLAAGEILDLPSTPTLSDGTAGGIEADSATFPLCRELVDEFAVVNEDEIAECMRLFIDRQQQLLEGAAGVAIAGMMRHREAITGRKVVVVICGGNISRNTLRKVI
jgi:threonine dehydratase